MAITANRPGRFPAAGANSVGTEVGELQVDADVLAVQQRHDLLQGVAILADHPDGVALDARLGLLLRVLDGSDDNLGLLRRDSLDQLDLLANTGVSRRLDL